MSIRNDMQMLPLQEQLQQVAHHLSTHVESQNAVVLQVVLTMIRTLIEKALKESTSELADTVRNDPLMANEFLLVMIHRAALIYSEKIRRILRQNTRFTTVINKIGALFDTFQSDVDIAMSGRKLEPVTTSHDAAIEQMIVKMHEKKNLRDHFAQLYQQGKFVIRPIEPGDDEGIRRLYMTRQYSVEQLVDIALDGFHLNSPMGKQTEKGDPARFLKDYNDPKGEGPLFRSLLEVTAEERRRGTLGDRIVRTLVGCVAASKDNLGIIHGVYAVARSPKHPKYDYYFKREKEQLIESGYSGGNIHWGKATDKDFYAKQLLEYPSSDLLLIAADEPGIADLLHHTTWRQGGDMGDVPGNECCFTFTARALHMILNGVPLEFDEDTGQNEDFLSWGPRKGFKLKQTWDVNPGDEESHRIDVLRTSKKIMRLESWHSWMHMIGRAGRLRRSRKKKGP